MGNCSSQNKGRRHPLSVRCVQVPGTILGTRHNRLASRKVPNFRAKILNFFDFLCFVNINTKGTTSENNIFCFYKATFQHSINCSETANFEFLRARF